MRRVWRLPLNCRSAVVQSLSDALPLFDIICKRAVLFIKNCFSSRSDVVSYAAYHSVYFSRMASVLRRNAFFSCEHFAMSIDDLMSDQFNARSVHDICLQRRTVTSYCRVICLLELLIIKRVFYLFLE